MSEYYHILKSSDSDSICSRRGGHLFVKDFPPTPSRDALISASIEEALRLLHERQDETTADQDIDWEARATAAEQQLATVTAERDMLARELQAKHGVAEDAYSATLAAARAISIMQSVHRLR